MDTKLVLPAMNRDIYLGHVQNIERETSKVVVGLNHVIRLAINGLSSDGHMLLVDVPGAGKTTLAMVLAATLRAGKWAFYQGTSDMLPSDLVGGMVLNLETRKLEWEWTVITPETNILLADEINRTPPKTQSSQLSVMQERKLGKGGQLQPCADPFLVIATMNPVEQEGVYAMAEAVLDRFALQVRPGELATNDEVRLIKASTTFARDQAKAGGVEAVVAPEDLIAMRNYAQTGIPVSDAVYEYIVRLVRATRVGRCEEAVYLTKEDAEIIELGAGRRGGIWLTATAKSHAAMRGADRVEFEDVQAMAPFALAHRMSLRPDAKFKFKGGATETPELQIIKRLLANVPTVAEPLPTITETAESAAEVDAGEEFATLDVSARRVNNAKKPWWKIFG